MITEAIIKLSKKEDLSAELLRKSFIDIIEGRASEAQIAAFLMGLSMKGETEEEILESVRLFREYAIKIRAPENAIDIVGTGGDHSGTFNVSTATTFVVAAAGVPVAKHGNRSASSQCGCIDVLEELGINVNMTPERAEKALFECGVTVLFAPLYHPAMKRVAPVRKELKIRTMFNILGPMLNPAQVKRQLLGVFSKQYMDTIAKVLMKLGSEDIMVVHSEDGLDEITVTEKTHIVRAKDSEVSSTFICPEDLGIKRALLKDIKSVDRKNSAEIFLSVLKGEKTPCLDMVLMNASGALQVAGIARDFKEGIEIAKESIYSGRAYRKFEEFKAFSNLN
ncbi:anthranilate phosphoribosyltransferase [Thermodesulfovibrio aggregans]|uniref:Anthranilate phosphoribosyltransferase n=1 Tax=Thermodesulfovibrio aggregans TaxID=86166 RepID=A0A0U9HTE3_9BACT|nr:anthranilate phosphoribosyltransferase [Thermodesulfovibrio aggregans]GAQ95689.1 anthranilate phosphoribosyltransferase [Thermodesulfovibrio aggregans]